MGNVFAAVEMSDASMYVLAGLVGLAGVASIILGIVAQIKKIKNDAEIRMSTAIKEAEAKAKLETKSEIAFKELTEAVSTLTREMQVQMTSMKETFTLETSSIKSKVDEHTTKIVALEASAKQAHKRIDEHRSVDHGIGRARNGHLEHIEQEA